MDINDKDFIQLNGLSSGYKVTQKLLKAFLLSNSDYLPHFGNSRRSETMKRVVTSKAKLMIMHYAYHVLN